MPAPPTSHRIGFVSTRFLGTDGVTLEAAKWAEVFAGFGHQNYWFAGKLGTPPEASILCEKAFFGHPEVADLQGQLFGTPTRDRSLTDRIHALKDGLKDALYGFVEEFGIDLLVPQNVLALPMHVPLGLAVTEFIAETGIATIAHHHDFSWERERFATTCVPEMLEAAFPPSFARRFEHCVINSPAARELARRRGVSATVVPNVFRFESVPPAPDAYSRGLRDAFGIAPDETLVLQPTRIVQRKGIEHAIDLVGQLQASGRRVCLVVSHLAGDEGMDYLATLQQRAARASIRMLLVGERVCHQRGTDALGQNLYTLGDVYQAADLVTYPSLYEGFGNAFLEAVYYRCPILINRYPIYLHDIGPLGFQVVEIDNIVTPATVAAVEELLDDASLAADRADHNYALATRHFSFAILAQNLEHRLHSLFALSG
ncbi:glycosyltransferase family 4 protein [soil metagenome]